MTIVWSLTIGLLALIGLVEVVEFIKRWVLSRKGEPKAVICLPLTGREPDVEYAARSLMQELNDHSSLAGGPLYLIDMGLPGEKRDICLRMQQQYEQLRFVKVEEFLTSLELRADCKGG